MAAHAQLDLAAAALCAASIATCEMCTEVELCTAAAAVEACSLCWVSKDGITYAMSQTMGTDRRVPFTCGIAGTPGQLTTWAHCDAHPR